MGGAGGPPMHLKRTVIPPFTQTITTLLVKIVTSSINTNPAHQNFTPYHCGRWSGRGLRTALPRKVYTMIQSEGKQKETTEKISGKEILEIWGKMKTHKN